MWLDSRFKLCLATKVPLILHGGEDFGAPFLVDRLRRERLVAWLAIEPGSDDPVSIGNRLAEAVNGVLAGNLLQHALPYEVHLRSLGLLRDQLPPLTVAVSGVDLAPEFARSIVQAGRPELGAWLISDGQLTLPGANEIGVDTLRLTKEEARELAPSGLPDEVVESAYAQAGGAYSWFLAELHRRAGLPEIQIPLADGRVFARRQARLERPEDVVEAMIRLGRWVDALEVAAEHLPDRVAEILVEAGPAYQQQGLLPRLQLLLSILPAPFADSERTLEWLLVAAHHSGASASVLPRVRRYLESHEAPELRARYAAFIPYRAGLEESQRALAALPTPLTLWQAGRMDPDPEKGIELLTRSVAQAELEGDAYGCVRGAGSLAERFIHTGDFESARSWAGWGLQLFDEHGIKDGVRRLRLYNQYAFARMMLADTAGLREQLQDQHATVENVLPELAAGYRSALADLERVEGDPRLAGEYTRANLETAPRSQKGLRASQHVRSLLELGQVEAALDVAKAAVALSAGTPAIQDQRAKLALGMAQAFSDPDGAATLLRDLLDDRSLVFEHRATAALHFLLARPQGMNEIPSGLRGSLHELNETALRVLSGPPQAFHRVWSELGGGQKALLELKVLGKASARLEGNEVKLTRRHWEILVALALHPDGLDYDALHAFLLHDDDRVSPGTLRSHVSHLRSQIPITDNPYRIGVPYAIDIVEVQEHLRAGKIREAISLFNGSVLPRSSLPGIREVSEQLEQAIRESILASGDPESLYSATALWDDDLQIWEASLGALHPRDPRVPLLRARVNSLQREYGTD